MKRRHRMPHLRRSRARSSTGLLVGLGCLLTALFSALLSTANGQERNFAGSVQGAYLYAPDDKGAPARSHTLDGFTTEASVKVAVDFGEHISTAVKMCFGCHGFEVGMAFIDLTVANELRFRIGRFSPSFGEFTLRHDPANHRTVDKPLPYDMGRMLRGTDWNYGVLPSPYVDSGLELSGTHWFGYTVQLDYAAYAVSGLRGASDGLDLDFIQSRSAAFYYIDNNSRPSGGARVALTLDLPDEGLSFTAGASGMAGYYDPSNTLAYGVAGVDFYARIKKLELRGEYLVRRTEISLGEDPASRFKYGPGDSGRFDKFVLKDGFYVEALYPVLPRLELVARFDGLRQRGNVARTSTLRKETAVLRYTLGADISVGYGVRIKLSGEYYDFSDFRNDFAATLGVVAVL